MNDDALPLVGRLAPSPTGAQHLGNARTYLLAWLSIRSRGGRVVMRIEDIDSPRVKSWAVQQAMDDLRWLGLDWDVGPDCSDGGGPYVQTERRDRYTLALEQLKRANQVYPCTCSRSEVLAAASAPHAEHESPVYAGTCAHRLPADAASLEVGSFSWRYRTNDTSLSFDDGFAGTQTMQLSRGLGDFIIAKGDGSASYQLAVVVDDHEMAVTEVLRGDDLIPSTFRQLAIYSFFAWTPPQFVHVPLVVGTDGRRLAKRHGDTRLSTLRDAGVAPETLIGFLAQSCGLRPTAEPIAASELVIDFDLSALPMNELVVSEADYRALR